MTLPDNSLPRIDALLPAEVAEKAEQIGVQKTRLDAVTLLVLAVLGGAFIALGAMFATTVLAGAEGYLPFGAARLLAGLVFCLGLILVVVGGAELFTGNTLMVIACVSQCVRLSEMLRAWLIVYAGNFLGGLGTAALVFLSGQYLSGKAASPASRSISPMQRSSCRSSARCSWASSATFSCAWRSGFPTARAPPPTRYWPSSSPCPPSSSRASSIPWPTCT